MRRVRVGNKTVATLRQSDVEALNLEIGIAWTARVAAAVEQTIAANRARQHAIQMLGRRQLSHAEVVERLIKKGHASRIAEFVALELARNGWINDAAMAAAIHDELIQRKAAGPKLVRAKLQSRKLDPRLLESSRRSAAFSDDAFANALHLATRRFKSMANLPDKVASRRIAATLARKGHDDEIIERVLEHLHLQPIPQDES